MCVHCPWSSSVPRQLCSSWRRWHKVALEHSYFLQRGVWVPAFLSRWPFKDAARACEPQINADVLITSSTVLTLFSLPVSQIPSFLLCYAFSSQCSLQSVAENDYKLCVVLSFIVITCICLPFLCRPTPLQGQSTG